MAVIINDMEVVIETPQQPQPGTVAAPPSQTPIRPLDILDILARRKRQEWRLLAH